MGVTKYFINVFAQGGDRTAVPNPTSIAGTVSYENGWTPSYSLPYPSDPTSIPVARLSWNQIAYDITQTCQQYQQHGVPNFITTADNAGSPYPYSKDSVALYDDGVNGVRVFQSLQDNNTSDPSDSSSWVWLRNSAGNLNIQNVPFDSSVTEGMAVYRNGAIFYPAIANGTVAQFVVGIASRKYGTVFTFGQCIDVLSGLIPYRDYFLSSTVAGEITTTQGQIRVGTTLTSSNLNINIISLNAGVSAGDLKYTAIDLNGVSPPGWLICNGAAVSRATYSSLFAAIGTQYGVGDGTTTFNIPNLQGQFLRGFDPTGTVDVGRGGVFDSSSESDEIGNHNHRFGWGGVNASADSIGAGNPWVVNNGGSGNTFSDLMIQNFGGIETRPVNYAFYSLIKT